MHFLRYLFLFLVGSKYSYKYYEPKYRKCQEYSNVGIHKNVIPEVLVLEKGSVITTVCMEPEG